MLTVLDRLNAAKFLLEILNDRDIEFYREFQKVGVYVLQFDWGSKFQWCHALVRLPSGRSMPIAKLLIILGMSLQDFVDDPTLEIDELIGGQLATVTSLKNELFWGAKAQEQFDWITKVNGKTHIVSVEQHHERILEYTVRPIDDIYGSQTIVIMI